MGISVLGSGCGRLRETRRRSGPTGRTGSPVDESTWRERSVAVTSSSRCEWRPVRNAPRCEYRGAPERTLSDRRFRGVREPGVDFPGIVPVPVPRAVSAAARGSPRSVGPSPGQAPGPGLRPAAACLPLGRGQLPRGQVHREASPRPGRESGRSHSRAPMPAEPAMRPQGDCWAGSPGAGPAPGVGREDPTPERAHPRRRSRPGVRSTRRGNEVDQADPTRGWRSGGPVLVRSPVGEDPLTRNWKGDSGERAGAPRALSDRGERWPGQVPNRLGGDGPHPPWRPWAGLGPRAPASRITARRPVLGGGPAGNGPREGRSCPRTRRIDPHSGRGRGLGAGRKGPSRAPGEEMTGQAAG
jgi:hypothetical protein